MPVRVQSPSGTRTSTIATINENRSTAFVLAQLEQIPIALLFQRLRDRHRVLEKTIVLRGAGLRRERVLARGVLTGLRIPATHLANNALVDGVGQLGDVPKQAFSKPED